MRKKIVILGGGPTGLRIAKYLIDSGSEVTVIEKTGSCGGMAGSFKHKGFTLDYGPHKFYTQLPGVYDDFKKIVGEGNYLTVKKKNSIRLLGKYFDFPVKMSQLLMKISPVLGTQIMLDFTKKQFSKRKVVSYEDYFVNGFGEKGYSVLFKGFAEKVWGDPKRLSAELARKRSPVSNVFDILKSALIKSDENVSAEYFLYPKKGKGVICDNLAKEIIKEKGRILLKTIPTKVNVKNKKVISVSVKTNNKIKTIPCDVLVSTISINNLPGLIKPSLPNDVLKSVKNLKYRSLIISYSFVKKERLLDSNWIFFPEKEFCFSRVAEQKTFSPFVGPKEKTMITAEVPCDSNSRIFSSSDEDIRKKVVKDLEKAGLVNGKEIYEFFTKRAKQVYPVYGIGYKSHLNVLLDNLDEINNLFTVGRLGLFNYNNVDHCLDMARVVSKIIIEEKDRVEWKKAREYFDKYRIVD